MVLVLLVGSGCGSKSPLMPTPSIYTHADYNPFAEVPKDLRGNQIEVLYLTDRRPEHDSSGAPHKPDETRYGHSRSRSLAFGVARMQIGDENLTWDELVAESRTAKREIPNLNLSMVSTNELGRLADTPRTLATYWHKPLTAEELKQLEAQHDAMEQKFAAVLSERLAKTPRKDVYVFVHGFDNTFDDSIFTIGELWHFLGREGVPIAYSWPAGMGVLRAYEYTNQSAMFTTYHMKQALRMIASCPDVERVHLIAHSRGTAVVTSAVRELVLEIRGKGDLQKELKLGTCVLAAADLDFDVFIAQDVNARDADAVDAVAIYVFQSDKALAFSKWLAGGSMRLGDVQTGIFNKEEVESLRHTSHIQFIDARITKPGAFGHSYFHENPAVSSDLILFLRYGLPPGGPKGRPLGISDTGFWIVDDDYPTPINPAWFGGARG